MVNGTWCFRPRSSSDEIGARSKLNLDEGIRFFFCAACSVECLMWRRGGGGTGRRDANKKDRKF